MAFESQQLLTLIIAESPLQLAWSFPPSPFATALDINRLEALDVGCAIVLPNATLNPTAQSIRFYNVGDNAVEIQLFGGIPLLDLEPGEYYQFSLVNNSTPAGEWISVPYVAGAVNISNFTIKSDTNNSITVLNGNVTGTGQVVTIQQPSALQALVTPVGTNLDLKGVLCYDPNNGTPVFYSRPLNAGNSNIVITDADGTTGNPTISLNTTLTNLSSISFGNTAYTAQGITSSGTDIIISTGGAAGVVNLNGTTADSDGNLNVTGALAVQGGFASPQVPIAWARITDTTTGATNVLTTQDSFNAIITQSVPGKGGTYILSMPAPPANTYYGVQCSCGTESITVPPLFGQIIYSSATVNEFSFVVTDAGGTIVSEVPNSLTITVFSSGYGSDSAPAIYNSYASMYMKDNIGHPTVITDADLGAPVVGTTTAGLLRNFTMPSDNKLVYTGLKPITAIIRVVASGTTLPPLQNRFRIGFSKNDINIGTPQYTTPIATGQIACIVAEIEVNLVTNDFLRVVGSTDPDPFSPPYSITIEEMNVIVQSVS